MSSACMIMVTVQTKDNVLAGGLESGCIELDPATGGFFELTAKALEDMKELKELIDLMVKWLVDRIDCCDDEMDAEDVVSEYGSDEIDFQYIFSEYGSGDLEEMLSIHMDQVRKISIFSGMEWCDEPLGDFLIDYNFETKEWDKEESDGDTPELYEVYTGREGEYRAPEIPEGYLSCEWCEQYFPEEDIVVLEEREYEDQEAGDLYLCKKCFDMLFAKGKLQKAGYPGEIDGDILFEDYWEIRDESIEEI